MLPFELINEIMSYITVATPSGRIMKDYNTARANGYICIKCDTVILSNSIALTCPSFHNTCWKCLVISMRQEDIDCGSCQYTFQCLIDELPHINYL